MPDYLLTFMAASQHLETLREAWKKLYTTTLPQLAKRRDSAQPAWPVTLDHCFARIILDNTIGKGETQWDHVISKPAVKNMSVTQLQAAIELGEKIKDGRVNLVELDRQSLEARGKREAKYKDEEAGESKANGMKRKRDQEPTQQSSQKSRRVASKTQSTLVFTSSNGKEPNPLPSPATSDQELAKSKPAQQLSPDLPPAEALKHLRAIKSHASLTPFRKRLYTSLLSVPIGEYTTYAALADHLHSSARAVGNGMRNNPFAPQVPCHRVLASDGSLGGYCGDWGRGQKGTQGYQGKQHDKVKLLESEGVKFDSAGKVKGRVWRGFWDWEDFERLVGKV